MTTRVTEVFSREQITEDILEDASWLFNENYGTWGPLAADNKPGSRVKMTAGRLRAEMLPEGSKSFLVRMAIDGTRVGHAFACRWQYNGRQVLWITQLVMHQDYRRRGLGPSLILALFDRDDAVCGTLSSHPYSCTALEGAALAFARSLGKLALSPVCLDFVRDHAEGVKAASPIEYVRQAKLHGSLFHPEDTSGLVCGVDSHFYVDHNEFLNYLAIIQEKGQWRLGDLPEGYEFLLLFEMN